MKSKIIFLLSMALCLSVACNKEEPVKIKEFPETLDGTVWTSVDWRGNFTLKIEDFGIDKYDSTLVYVHVYDAEKYITRYTARYVYPTLHLFLKNNVTWNGKIGNQEKVNYNGTVEEWEDKTNYLYIPHFTIDKNEEMWVTLTFCLTSTNETTENDN